MLSNEISLARSATHCSTAHTSLAAMTVTVTSAKSAIATSAWRAGFQLADFIDRCVCPAIVSGDDTKSATCFCAHFKHFTVCCRNYGCVQMTYKQLAQCTNNI
jgi:hypothetical protein